MNELIYYDLKQISGLSGSLSTQVSKELGRRIVAGIYTENDLIEDEKGLKKEKNNSQTSLFEFDEKSTDLTTIKNIEWEKKELLDREREMLGFFVSEDPLEGYGEIFRSESTHSVIELMDLEEDEEVKPRRRPASRKLYHERLAEEEVVAARIC